MADLLINGKDAKILGIRMGSGFIEELLSPYPLKEAITNESRLENGKRVLMPKDELEEDEIDYGVRYKDSREVTLTFTIEGVNTITFLRNLQRFYGLLYAGSIEIEVPIVMKKCKLEYIKSSSFGKDYNNTFCSVVVRFEECNILDEKEIKGSYNKSYNKSYR